MNDKISKRSGLRGGSALAALAMLGAGVASMVLPATAAFAQDYVNITASGRVVDASGNGIAGATVTVRSNAQGFERVATTTSDGGYRIPQLPPGTYTFTIAGPNGEAFSDPAVTLTQDSAGNTFELESSTAAADSEEGEIVVTGRRVRVADFERTTTGTVINVGDLATRIPVTRNISSIVQLSPGTTQGDRGFGDLPNIAGSSVAENAFYLNGLNLTNFRTGLGAVAVPFEFYQTVEVKNGGFQAEFGRATGGVVNAVSKSGGNEFHGGILFNWEPDDLRAKQRNTITEDNDADEFERTDTVLQLSGPIIKDRLFFYGLYNFRDVKTTSAFQALAPGATPANPSFLGTQIRTDRSNNDFYGGKLDAIITDGHRLEFTYFNTTNEITRTVFGTAAQAAQGGVRYNPATNEPGSYDSQVVFGEGGENYVGRYTGTFAPWITVSAAYGVNKDRETEESTTPDLPSVVDNRSGSAISIGNPAANADISSDRRTFYRGDVDLYFSLFGTHHIRAGYDREDLRTNIVTLANGGGQITIDNGSPGDEFGFTTGQYITNRFFQNGGEFNSQNEAFYIQDAWSLLDNRLTLQLGLRADKFTNNNIADTAYFDSGYQYGPRLGFTADPFGDGKTKVYGSFGRYFLPIAANTNNRLGGAELDFDRFFAFGGFGPNGLPLAGPQLSPRGGQPCPSGGGTCIIRADGQPGAIESLVSGNLEAQSLDEYILGAERRFGRRLRVGVFFTKRDLNATLEDAAVDTAVRAFCVANNLNRPNADGRSCAGTGGTGAIAGPDAIFDGTHQYVLLNPGKPARITLQDPINGETALRTVDFTTEELGIPEAVRRYRGYTLQVEREFDGIWSLAGSYTYSTLKGNTEGGVRSDNDQADTGATVDFDLPGLADGTFGFSPNHRRHNFKLYGSYKVADWLTVGANGSITSPKKFGCLGTVPSSRDAAAAQFYGANGTYCNLNADGSVRTTPATAGEILPPRQIVQRGSAFESDWQYVLNLDAQLRLPTEAFDGFFRVSVINVLNSKAEIDFEERGTLNNGNPRITYGQVTQFQNPRTVRLQLGVNF